MIGEAGHVGFVGHLGGTFKICVSRPESGNEN